MHRKLLTALALAGSLGLASSAQAVLITEGFTFSVASGNDTSVGTHFHSNTGGDFGNPAGKAEVGRFSTEEVRGLSEYDLTGLTNSPTAFVSFEVFDDGGLFPGTNDFPFDGTISIFSYEGNNAEDVEDYQAPTTGNVGSFSTASLVVGNTLSFEITGIFNDAIDAGNNSLGIRLQAVPLNEDGAWTFDNFRLSTEDETTSTPNGVIPEPATAGLFGLALAGAGAVVSRRRRVS